MDLSIFTYHFPFFNRFSSAISSLSHRDGLLLKAWEETTSHWVEVAPLDGFSRDSLTDCKEWLSRYVTHIPELLADATGWGEVAGELKGLSAPDSLQYGIEQLWIARSAYNEDVPVYRWLNIEAPSRCAVNKVEGLQDLEALIDSSDELRLDKAAVYKIKASKDPLPVFERLELIAKVRPDLQFRIDPNGSWSVNEAVTYLNELENSDLTIEYCEQPIQSGDIEGLEYIRSQTSIPIAVDEDAAHPEQLTEVIEKDAADVIIVKPMRFGSIYRLNRLLAKARNKGMDIVFTTLLEAGLGRLQTAHLAAAMGSAHRAHGLDTGALFEKDLWNDRQYFMNSEGGYQFLLPGQPGLGYPPPEQWQDKLKPLTL